MKHNKLIKRIGGLSLFLIVVVIFVLLVTNVVQGIIYNCGMEFHLPHDLACSGQFEPFIDWGLNSKLSCVSDYFLPWLFEYVQGAGYAGEGTSLIALTSSSSSTWEPYVHDQPHFALHILWPFKVVRKDGASIPLEHDTIPLALDYHLDLAGFGQSCSLASIQISATAPYSGSYQLARIGWILGDYLYCPSNSTPIAETNTTSGGFEVEPSGSIYFTCMRERANSISVYVQSHANSYVWTDNHGGVNSPISHAFSLLYGYLYIDPNWEFANEYQVLTVKDAESDLADPSSWVPHVRTPVDMVKRAVTWVRNNGDIE